MKKNDIKLKFNLESIKLNKARKFYKQQTFNQQMTVQTEDPFPIVQNLEFPGFDETDLNNIQTIFKICSFNQRKTLEISFLKELLASKLDYAKMYKPQIDKYFEIFQEKTNKTDISFEEFINLLNVQNKKDETIENLRYVFNLFDKEQNGYLTLSSLRKRAKEIGEDISENELVEMIERADNDLDGKISLQDFYCIFLNNYSRI